MIKKIIFVFVALAMVFAVSPAFAEDVSTDQSLPTRWGYAYEWINLNLFTWKAESKVKVYDQYATERAQNIATAYNSDKADQVGQLSTRFKFCETEMNQIMEQSKIADKATLLLLLQKGAIERQKILSEVRASLQDEEQRKNTAALQEESVNNIKNTIASIEDKEAADKFSEQIVSTWRDPKNTINDEQETRVYAAGTSENGTIDEGVIIDGGEAKISKDGDGNLKIEYAPGTGPSSITADNGKKLWKIQMSDGSIVESYTAGGNVVVGQSSGTASNIIVNTVAGGTSSTANVVVGSGSGSANTVIVGGKSVVTSGDSGSETTVNGSTESVNQSDSSGTAAGQVIEQTAP